MDAEELDRYVSAAFTLEQIVSELEDSRCAFMLAEIGVEGVGYAKVALGSGPDCVEAERPIELERIYALQTHIGQGVGSTLMRTCLDFAVDSGCDVIWLGVWEQNQRAIRFYERFGFEIVGETTFLVGTDLQRDVVFARSIRPDSDSG